MSAPTRIGPYTIEREIGRGGMGVVYLGRDPRLGREVAVKMLPEAFAHDPERVQRFEREARLLASLSHPNIAGIHGLEEQEGHRYLVLEYVPGPTLAERIAQGPLPVDDVADIGRQIAAALEAAHESGVIHRDLKPGNVKITPAGEVKVLDFGLAKGVTAGSGVSASDLSQSPTVAVTATGSGVILGTAAYMSPEQARAKPLDRRTDIWSFGCVLYECLTGRRVFEGETASDLIALILQGSPDWTALPADTPPRMRALLERCLEKDAKKRLRDIGEARLALEAPWEPVSGIGMAPAVAMAPTRWKVAAWVLAGLLAVTGVTLAWTLVARPVTTPAVMRLSVLPPPGSEVSREPVFASLSPDGTTLAFTFRHENGPPYLWVRSLDDAQPHRLEGTSGAILSAWSPDGRSIVFSTAEQLMRVDLRGGSPRALADTRTGGRGASWGTQDVIVFAPGGEGPLYKISANGGPVEQVTVLDSTETAHRFPELLPDGIHFLYSTLPARGQGYDIYIGSTDGTTREFLMNCDGVPRYAEPGLLVYTRAGRVLAQRFDATNRTLHEAVMTLVDEPAATNYQGASRLVVSRSGTLAYLSGARPNTDLVVLDRAGRRLRTIEAPEGHYVGPALSPDETQLALVKVATAGSDLWIVHLDRAGLRRLTPGGTAVDQAAWSPDGSRLAYAKMIQGRWEIVLQSVADGAQRVLDLPDSPTLKYVTSWTPDGRLVLGHMLSERNGWDLWFASTDGEGDLSVYASTPFDERYPRISPDGRWVAYSSTESGRPEVYVQSFPVPGRRYLISDAGATEAWWSDDGRRLSYRTLNGAAIVNLQIDDGVRTGSRVGLFSTPLTNDVRGIRSAAISGDFERIYASIDTGSDDLYPFTVVLNWRSALEPE